MAAPENRIQDHLVLLYGEERAQGAWQKLSATLKDFHQRNPHLANPESGYSGALSERDAILITYGDQIREPGQPALRTLADFLEAHLSRTISGVHILPFYPSSSDDGFSVIDYYQVDPELGDWEDIRPMSRNFRLMFDLVINHVSRQSEWFKAYQRREEPYKDFFIEADPATDLSMVVRPRALPLLTPVDTKEGKRYTWTTFSEDQIDLNFANPEVLLEIVKVLLFYAERGAEIIRLDAIAYLWKEVGSPSIHHAKTHQVVKLLRAILDAVAPGVVLITETNVPHEENISYFGEPLPEASRSTAVHSGDEAQMVYQFALAPLVLHSFLSGDASKLSAWAASLEVPFPSLTFFNFIASHDGIGVRPAEGLLDAGDIQQLIERTLAHGGQVSFRTKPDGTKSVYELNTTLFDALNDPNNPQAEIDEARFLASQVIMISLAGVPGIYIHSLFGSRNCDSCVEETGRARSINRQKFQRAELEAALADPDSRQARHFFQYKRLLEIRCSHPAFNPSGYQKVLAPGEKIFAILRIAADESGSVLCLVNVSGETQRTRVEMKQLEPAVAPTWRDLISRGVHSAGEDGLRLTLEGYQYMWLAPEGGLPAR